MSGNHEKLARAKEARVADFYITKPIQLGMLTSVMRIIDKAKTAGAFSLWLKRAVNHKLMNP